MKANEYQYLLGNVYYGGLPHNADVDMYLKMQNEYLNFCTLDTEDGQLEGEYAFRKSFLVIRNYVKQAIRDGLRNFQFKMRTIDINKLTVMDSMLKRDFFDKKSLDEIIITANSVFNRYN